MNRYIQLVRNIGLFGIASFASKFISFLLLPMYTAYLTTEEYAIVDLAIVVQSLLWPVLSLAISDAVLRFGFEEGCDHKKLYSISWLVIIPGLLVASMIFMFVNFEDSVYSYRIFFLIYYIAVSINSFQSFFARTLDQVDLIVKISLFITLLIAAINVFVLVILHMGAEGYFIALILGNAISAIVYFVFGKYKAYVIKIKCNDFVLLKELLVYSIPMIPNSVFWWVNSSLDKFCLTALVGLGAVGLYSAAGKISSILNIITTIFSQAWSISAFKEYNKKDATVFYNNIYRIYSLLCLLLATLIIGLNPVISKLLFSKEFEAATGFVPLLVLAFFYSALNIFYGSLFTAFKKTNIIFWTTGAGALGNLMLNFLLINSMGAAGAAVATFISNLVVYLFRMTLIRKYVEVSRWIPLDFVSRMLLVFYAFSVTLIKNIALNRILICAILVITIYKGVRLFHSAYR